MCVCAVGQTNSAMPFGMFNQLNNAKTRFIAIGAQPIIATFAAVDEGKSLVGLVSTVATKLTSAVFNIAAGWLGRGKRTTTISSIDLTFMRAEEDMNDEEILAREKPERIPLRYGLSDPDRRVVSINLDPRYACMMAILWRYNIGQQWITGCCN